MEGRQPVGAGYNPPRQPLSGQQFVPQRYTPPAQPTQQQFQTQPQPQQQRYTPPQQPAQPAQLTASQVLAQSKARIPTEQAAGEEIKWLQQLQSFIFARILAPIIPDANMRAKYVAAQPMITWAKAFTHETFSSKVNYEELEYLGDAGLKFVFPQYLMKKYPTLNKLNYTELNNAYMSKVGQADFARKMGLGDFVRVRGLPRSTFNLDADVFESFFGALITVSDTVVANGVGYINTYNMIVHLFKDVLLDMSRAVGSAHTRVEQIFRRFGLGKPEEIVQEVNDETQVTVRLTPRQIAFLTEYGVVIADATIGQGVAFTKREASPIAYTEAAATLARYGISTEWAELAKKYREMSDPQVSPYVQGARDRLAREDFSDMYFFIPRKTATKRGAVVELVGIRPDAREEVLAVNYTTDVNNFWLEGKVAVISKYAAGQQIR
jgi:dsRNA-specific ribonuclease